MDLTGKNSLIVGMTHTLAGEIAQALVEAGANVVGSYAGPAEAVAASLAQAGGRVTLLAGNPDGPEQAARLVEQAVANLGRLDIAVILPGEIPPGPFLELTEADWAAGLAANVAGPLYAMQAAARQMVAQGSGGRIIAVSAAASEMAFHETCLMGTSLAALNTLAQVAAVELGPHRITVNVITPGWIEAGQTGELHFAAPYRPAAAEAELAYITAGIPLGRTGQAQEVGQLCAFLASEAASYVTGTLIKVDGGYTITKASGNRPYPARPPWPTFDAGYDPATADF